MIAVKEIMAIALSLGASPQQARFIGAIALCESRIDDETCNPQARGDFDKRSRRYLSWGLFGFKRARWEESGGEPSRWGKADAQEQIRVMLGAARLYGDWISNSGLKLKTDRDRVRLMARCHNNGSVGNGAETDYTRRAWRYYAKLRAKPIKTKYADAEASILRAARRYQAKFAYAPTYTILARRCRLPLHVVSTTVPKLEREGMIRRQYPDIARCWEIKGTEARS